MIQYNPVITGSLTVNGNLIVSGTTSATSSNAISASTAVSSSYTVSASAAVSSSYATSASAAVSSSYATSASSAVSAANSTLFNSTASRVFATTGSNNLTGDQHITSVADASAFAATASLYTDGGLQVAKNAYFSSSMFIKGDLTVYGTQSIAYITSSQLNIATNVITVNTATPSVRFGGISVYDSGSTGTGVTGSLFWDSQNNNWIYNRESGSTYGGGMLISGPRRDTGSAMGCEQGTTACALMMGQGGDHITSSAIFSYGNATCFYGTSVISSTGTVSGTCLYASSVACASIGKFTTCLDLGGGLTGTNASFNSYLTAVAPSGIFYGMQIYGASGAARKIFVAGQQGYSDGFTVDYTGTSFNYGFYNGNVGIGTASPSQKLEVVGGEIKAGRVDSSSEGGQVSFGRALDNTTSWYIDLYGSSTSPQLRFVDVDNSAVRMVITGSNVGIGTSTPSSLLHTYSSTTSTQTIAKFGAANYGSAASKTYIQIGTQYDDGSSRIGSSNPSGNLSELFFETATSTSGVFAERMRITSGGNVGMAGTLCTLSLYLTCTVDAKICSGAGIGLNIDGSALYLNRYSCSTISMVPNGGSVGIGTSNPGYVFHMMRCTDSAYMTIETGASTAGVESSILQKTPDGISLITLGASAARAVADSARCDWIFGLRTGGCIRFSAQVAANNTQMIISPNGSIGINGSNTTNIYNASDCRLKKNIQTTNYGIASVMCLNPVRFNWIDGFEDAEKDKNMLGFIAQEVQNVVPEAVNHFSLDSLDVKGTIIENPLSVNEKYLIPVLTKALQEAVCKINTLETCLGIN